MNFLRAAYTDQGPVKSINQDSLIILETDSAKGRILLAAIADGMGGLTHGEIASATMIADIETWFQNQLPSLLKENFQKTELYDSWSSLCEHSGNKMLDYARENQISMGTTLVALLCIEDHYYIMNVGDSRAYLVGSKIWQLTKDQTVTEREIEAGRITREEAQDDPRQSILLQCIGASEKVVPDFSYGTFEKGQLFLLCSDGFRHQITPTELSQNFQPDQMRTEEIMQNRLKEVTNLLIARGEEDNISSVLVKPV